jgi:integrase
MHTVYISQDLMNLIKMYIDINKEKWLFPSVFANSTHMSSRTAYNILQRNLKKANLPQRPFHALRATCVKMCQRARWSAEQTAEHLDDQVRTIQQHYSTPSDEEMKKIAEERKIL